jgi:hypothetical protein
MTNIFEETYNHIEEAKKAYKEATTAEERDAAREAAKEAEDRIDEMGDIAWKIWRAYEKSRDNENEILDFDDIIWDRDVEALTACMRENGIKAFTYSCRATDAVETLWLFKRQAARSARWLRSTSGRTSSAKATKRATPSR